MESKARRKPESPQPVTVTVNNYSVSDAKLDKILSNQNLIIKKLGLIMTKQ